jgi:hypothetical protein
VLVIVLKVTWSGGQAGQRSGETGNSFLTQESRSRTTRLRVRRAVGPHLCFQPTFCLSQEQQDNCFGVLNATALNPVEGFLER